MPPPETPADDYLLTELPDGIATALVRSLLREPDQEWPLFAIGDRWWAVEAHDDPPILLLLEVANGVLSEPTGVRALVKLSGEYAAGGQDHRITPRRTGVPPVASPEFVRGWHEGYRAAKDDALRVARHGGHHDARAVFGRLVDWNEGYPPSDFTPAAAPVAVEQEVPR